jgi:hypothetical protein
VKSLRHGDEPIDVTVGRVQWPALWVQNVRAREAELKVAWVHGGPSEERSIWECGQEREYEEVGNTMLPAHERGLSHFAATSGPRVLSREKENQDRVRKSCVGGVSRPTLTREAAEMGRG